jgi:diguanylate cyclase (GGDEF)-like protein
MEDYKLMYDRLREEFEIYQNFAESQMQHLNDKNIELEKNLDALTNIIEISKYINSYISDDNLMAMINDVIVGVLGVNYSTIYLLEHGKYVVKATNTGSYISTFDFYNTDYINSKDGFVINSTNSLFPNRVDRCDIHSVIGVPIKIRDEFIGYIIVEHKFFNFFNNEHIEFLSSIANQIAIAIENSLLYKKVEESSKKDPLLGIYNRKYFFEVVDKNIKSNQIRTFAIVMADIDDFKRLNDNYGHQFGDEVLQHITKILVDNIGEKDMLARYGGEEMVLFLDSCISQEDVFKKVDGIRQQIQNTPVYKGDIPVTVTVSFGLSFYPFDGFSSDNVLRVADMNLYKAKNSGKNMVVSSHLFR